MKSLLVLSLMAILSNASAATINCGGNQPGTLGAKINFALRSNSAGDYSLYLTRENQDRSVILTDQLIASDLTCRFSKLDARAVSCSGGTRMSPQYFQISVNTSVSADRESVETRFDLSVQSQLIANLGSSHLDINEVFGNGKQQPSVIRASLSDPYTCVRGE